MGVFNEERFFRVIDAILKGDQLQAIAVREHISKKTIHDYIARLNKPGDAYYNPQKYQMIKQFRQNQRDKKLLKTAVQFLAQPNSSLKELSDKLNEENPDILEAFSSSTVQRYLTDERLRDLIGQEVFESIQSQLQMNKHSGQVKGGLTSFAKNQHKKDENNNKFTGVIAQPGYKRVLQKLEDVFELQELRSQYPEQTFEEIARIFNSKHSERQITKDYAYDCIMKSPQYVDIFKDTRRL